MKFCDLNSGVLEWSSEEVVIPYISPFDNKYHRYFVDFWIKVQDRSGNIKCKLVEIKPSKQTRAPEPPKKRTPKFLNEMRTWAVNSSKWKAAVNYCKQQGWEFLVVTEKNLFKNGK